MTSESESVLETFSPLEVDKGVLEIGKQDETCLGEDP